MDILRLASFLPAWWMVQAAPGGSKSIWEYGIGVGMALLIAALWREDRKSRVDTQTASDERYATLAKQMMVTIEENAKNNAKLSTALEGKINNCPLENDPLLHAWMRAWMQRSAEDREQKVK